MRCNTGGLPRLLAALTLGTGMVWGCSPTAEQTEPASESGQYNEVRWAGTLGDGGTDVAVRELLFPSGWTAPLHFHNSDLFIYVLDGEFEVSMAGEDPVTYMAGQALEMRTETQMTARNVSAAHPLKLVVFQVGQTEEPFVVPVPDSLP